MKKVHSKILAWWTKIKKKCTYKLWDIVCVVILAVLSNCNEWDEIYYFTTTHKKWLKSFLKLTGEIPQPTTYERVVSIIDPHELNNLYVEFTVRLIEMTVNSQYDFYHFDGKVDKGSGRKTNEITVIPDVIKRLNIKNVICTWDAKWYEDAKSWKGLKTIGLVVKTMENKKGEKVIEKRYYILSLLLDIYNFSKAIRNYWNVENKLHW